MAKEKLTVAVKEKDELSPNMVRLLLEGESLREFPTGFEGGYIKLVLDNVGGAQVRSYTIREHDPITPGLTIDMVRHGDKGPAARWANSVSVGDSVDILGPGPCRQIDPTADWFLLAGDMSALPAICVNLDQLPETARGYVVLEVIDKADQLPLSLPDGMQLHWILNEDPDVPNSMLEDTVMSLPWLDGRLSAWVAGEFSASRALRQYFRHEREVPKDNVYVSCYWKIGDTDEGMKVAKRADPESW